MKLYEIVLDEGRYSDVKYHILAENFADAFQQATKRVGRIDVANMEKARSNEKVVEVEITSISLCFNIDVVK